MAKKSAVNRNEQVKKLVTTLPVSAGIVHRFVPGDAIEDGRVLVGGKPMLNPRARVADDVRPPAAQEAVGLGGLVAQAGVVNAGIGLALLLVGILLAVGIALRSAVGAPRLGLRLDRARFDERAERREHEQHPDLPAEAPVLRARLRQADQRDPDP